METIQEWVSAFSKTIDDIYGVFLDATLGIDIYRDQILPHLNRPGTTNSNRLHFGDGDPNLPSTRASHTVTVGEFKERIQKDGTDYRRIASALLVTLYQYWEDEYRIRLSHIKGMEKNMVRSDQWGDVRILRTSIIHNGGIAIDDVKKMKVFTTFLPGEVIHISSTDFKQIVLTLKASVIQLAFS